MIIEQIRDVNKPERANTTDSWIDFYIPNDLEEIISHHWDILYEDLWLFTIPAWYNVKIPLWIRIRLDEWYDLTFFNKSGIASQTWLIVGACVIDNWYRWELVLNLINTSKDNVTIQRWKKIVQGIIRKCEYVIPVEWVIDDATDRWQWWFGSTGL